MIVKTKMTKTVVDTDKVAQAVQDLIDDHYDDDCGLVFGPILVEPRVVRRRAGHWALKTTSELWRVYDDGQVSEDYLRILILYEGDRKDLDTRWDAYLPVHMEPAMEEMGLEHLFILKLFTDKGEWEEYHREAAKRDQI